MPVIIEEAKLPSLEEHELRSKRIRTHSGPGIGMTGPWQTAASFRPNKKKMHYWKTSYNTKWVVAISPTGSGLQDICGEGFGHLVQVEGEELDGGA